mmetsp:Transcript_43398/g.70411  ORF Transcript_43398/g.70411 Transcript_43398/m.70411 type:complete len:257 (-) Transcript_43398:656-1426(-)|eukprot:CAMPEP_0184647180 /NCGR_PEP_ID=MMETSP0308-20130426/4090_1 /TAXON_ID=38269 /ORGANISM="Gloeochaete witrockiana, Strain SAG 46.84" /LENGTH=256 /DNA_ID=CAMNT_0027077967 /DNA_START=33 /DNA_END=803 /DNA_ORIENTATION=+
MALLYKEKGPASLYVDHRYVGSQQELERLLLSSTTVYIGNLSFFTTEEQILELFTKCGEVKRIIMGLDRMKKTPCGFCFVEYYSRTDAEDCVLYISGTRLDDRVVRADWDYGFRDGRQFGRGKSGGQVRDEYRTDYDPGRGGWGKQRAKELEQLERERAAAYEDIYDGSQIPVGGESRGYAPRTPGERTGIDGVRSAGKEGATGKRMRDDVDPLDGDDVSAKRSRVSDPGPGRSRGSRYRGGDGSDEEERERDRDD